MSPILLNSYITTDDGAKIHFEDHGRGPVILLVHGWNCSTRFWRLNIPDLSGQFRVVALDLRGHGNSSKILTGHVITRYARDVRALIEHLGLRDVTLLGWSLGGPVVLSYWQQYAADSRLKGLGLIDATPCPFSQEAWNSHGLKEVTTEGMNAVFRAMTDDPAGFARTFARRLVKDGRLSDGDMAWMTDEMRKTPTWISMAIYSDYLTCDYTAVLPTVTVPAIVFAGDSEVFVRGIEQGRHLAASFPRGVLVAFEDAGHSPFFERPAVFNAALGDFVRDL